MTDRNPTGFDPMKDFNDLSSQPETATHAAGGLASNMTLRDHFAGQALANCRTQLNGPAATPDYIAEIAYRLADAMLEARGTPTPVKTNLTQSQLDQMAKLVTFIEDENGDLAIHDVKGRVTGDVWGSIEGDVYGSIEGNVLDWKSVWGDES